MSLARSFLLLALFAVGAHAQTFPSFERIAIDPRIGEVCYAVTAADVDGDGKPDIAAISGEELAWYKNPTWAKSVILRPGATARDNVCLQASDVDGDGRVDFALGSAWQPSNTKTGGALAIVTRTGAGPEGWRLVPLPAEPTLHRVRFGDLLGTGKPQLIAAALQGRGTSGPDWGSGAGVKLLVLEPPATPFEQAWRVEVVDETLHATHNLQVVDLDDDGKRELLVASWEGVFLLRRGPDGNWTRNQLGVGNRESTPSKGSSEVKLGRLRDGSRYIATIEPWHGTQVVVYTPPACPDPKRPPTDRLWDRRVIDEPIAWGHAVWCADLDGDGDDEVVIGQRDPVRDPTRVPRGPGLLAFDPTPGSTPLAFTRHVIADGSPAAEDATVLDFDGDGRPDILAGGRATHDVTLFRNLGPQPAR